MRCGVRSIDQRVVFRRPYSCCDLVSLLANTDHRVDEPIDLAKVFTLGGLNHQCPRNGEGHRGGVEAIVDEALGHIIHSDTGRLSERSNIEHCLVGHQAVVPRVENGVVVAEPCCHVVGSKNRRRGGFRETIGSHHSDVSPGNRQDAGASIRGS